MDTTEETDSRQRRRRPIDKVNYDFFYRPLNLEESNDNGWELANPVDTTTGLWYDRDASVSKSGADWADLMTTFMDHGYEKSLGLTTTSKHPLLMVERSYNPPPIRQQALEIAMEEMDVPAVFFARDATLACYACGRTTSTVVDIGYSGTTVTPVYEGYVEQKGIRRSPVGSKAMDELALEHLQSLAKGGLVPTMHHVKYPKASRSDAFHNLAQLHVAMDCREAGAGQGVPSAASKTLHVPSISYSLPDGQTVDVPSLNRFEVADFVMGKPQTEEEAAAGNSSSSKESLKVNQRRQEATNAVQKAYSEYITAASHEHDNEDEDEDGKEQAKKYSDAAAVGISSRRTKRGAAAAAKPKGKTPKPKEGLFNNTVLQKACASYLQAQTEFLTSAPIASMVCDASFRCDRDQQAALLGNVVLGGGGACIGPTDQAVPDLLRDQMESIIHTHTPGWRVKMLSPGMQERSICSWLGGSILGSLGTFHEMWITKKEYEEWGCAIVNRKCP